MSSPPDLIPRRLYLDNAATSFPKPPEVMRAMCDYARDVGASVGRGGYEEAQKAGEIVRQCRRNLAELFNSPSDRSIVFTPNCTASLNLAIHGLFDHQPGAHVVSTIAEHNSILRPLRTLESQNTITLTLVDVDRNTGLTDPAQIAAAIHAGTRLIAISHASNVSGAIQPISDIARLARDRGVLLLVDAAQTAGHVPIDVRADGIDLLACSGHKGLLGPTGTGVLYVRPGVEPAVFPIMQGGTGGESERPLQPDSMPERFEAGTPNVVGLAGLAAGTKWILGRSVESVRAHEMAMTDAFLDSVRGVRGLQVYGPPTPAQRLAVFGITLKGFAPDELAIVLETEFGILARAGLHCAPGTHRAMGTFEAGGTLRLSFGALNTLRDVEAAAGALAEISAGAP